jgi:hypothetical protein
VAYMLLQGASAITMFGYILIDSCDLSSVGGFPSTHNIRVAGFVNDVIIKNNVYEAASSATGDGLTYNTATGNVAGWTSNAGTPTRGNILWGATG